jgi:pyrophosphatase PpaX
VKETTSSSYGPESLKAVIFDMDGTLVSSLSLIHQCENEISKKYTGRTLTLEDVISKFGPPARAIIRSLTSNLTEDLQSQAVKDYYECYSRNSPSRVLVFPGISDLLKRIRSSKRHLALMTGVERPMMEFTLNPFGLQTYFEEKITADDVRNSKPDPEGIILTLSRIDAQPRESIYIGDSPADMIAGRRAGVVTGAAMWSPENRGDPSKEHPDYEFRSVQHLSDFLFPRPRSDPEPYFSPDKE